MTILTAENKKSSNFWPLTLTFGLSIVVIFIYQFYMGYLAWLMPVEDKAYPKNCEPVLAKQAILKINSLSGPIVVQAGNGVKRTITFDGQTRSIAMWPRQTPFYGNYGLYFTGPGFHWKPVNGIARCIAIEGKLNFATKDEALNWLKEKVSLSPRLYRNDGLSVWTFKRDGTLGLDIIQVYINGQKPKSLDGADDKSIELTPNNCVSDTTKTTIYNPSETVDTFQ